MAANALLTINCRLLSFLILQFSSSGSAAQCNQPRITQVFADTMDAVTTLAGLLSSAHSAKSAVCSILPDSYAFSLGTNSFIFPENIGVLGPKGYPGRPQHGANTIQNGSRNMALGVSGQSIFLRLQSSLFHGVYLITVLYNSLYIDAGSPRFIPAIPRGFFASRRKSLPDKGLRTKKTFSAAGNGEDVIVSDGIRRLA
jgi:hypothetical protein